MEINHTLTNDLLTTRQAAQYLGLSPSTLKIWRSTKAVNIPYLKLGSVVRYRTRDLEKFINSHAVDIGAEKAEG